MSFTEDDAAVGTADPATETVSRAEFPDLGPGVASGASGPVDLLSDVDVTVTVELGKVRMRVRDLLALREGSVVQLDAVAGGPVDVLVNGTLVARGEVVVVGDDLGVRVTDIVRKA